MTKIKLLYAYSTPKDQTTRFDIRVGGIWVAVKLDRNGSIFSWLITHEFNSAIRRRLHEIRAQAERHVHSLLRCDSRQTRLNLTRQLDANGNHIGVYGSTVFCGNYAYKPEIGWYRLTSLTQAQWNQNELFGRTGVVGRWRGAR